MKDSGADESSSSVTPLIRIRAHGLLAKLVQVAQLARVTLASSDDLGEVGLSGTTGADGIASGTISGSA